MRLVCRCWFACLLVCGFSSCSDDDFNQSAQSDDVTLVLNIKTPASSLPRAATRSIQTADETHIENVKVLVFSDTNGDGTYFFNYMTEGTQLVNQQNQTSKFQVMLRSSSVPLKIYLVANYSDAFASYNPIYGDSEKTVKTSIRRSFTSDGMFTDLPMYGELSLSGLDAATINNFDVTVLRAIARVDVKTQLTSDSPAFALREVYVYRANDQIQIIPDAVSAGSHIRVSSPSVPSGSTTLASPVVKTSSISTDSIGGLYVPESVAPEKAGDARLTATTVVVGGIFGSSTDVSYYRVDFNSGITGHPLGQILRNYLYTFTIKKVSDAGYTSPDEAAANLASSMTVEVQQWEDFTTEMYFHDNYIGVSTRQVRIPYLPNYTRTVDIESSMNYEMQWVETPNAGKVSEADVPLSNGYFTATIVRNESESSYLSHIRIESPEYNLTDQPVQATLRLFANDTSVDITVLKESSSQYSQRIIRVLSVGTSYGSLGFYNLTYPVTLAMRNVLDANFTPTSSYPVRMGGFFFLTVNGSDPLYSNATTPQNIASFKKLINGFDVLLMTYANVTSPQVADMLLDEWLVEDPHRVLWVMRDNAASNASILARTAQDGEGVWNKFGDAFDATAGYRYSSEEDYAYNNAEEVKDFFDGPFGSIDNEPGKQILRPGDVVSGTCLLPDSSKQYVTPLVYSNKAGYKGYMSVGVNKRRGIVYEGEAQFFQYDIGMSLSANTNGTLTTTPDSNGKYYFDLIMANIWAWVAGRVIYGAAP